jgi:hypothetical protein
VLLSALNVPFSDGDGRQLTAELAVVFQQLSPASQAQSSGPDGPPDEPQLMLTTTSSDAEIFNPILAS